MDRGRVRGDFALVVIAMVLGNVFISYVLKLGSCLIKSMYRSTKGLFLTFSMAIAIFIHTAILPMIVIGHKHTDTDRFWYAKVGNIVTFVTLFSILV